MYSFGQPTFAPFPMGVTLLSKKPAMPLTVSSVFFVSFGLTITMFIQGINLYTFPTHTLHQRCKHVSQAQKNRKRTQRNRPARKKRRGPLSRKRTKKDRLCTLQPSPEKRDRGHARNHAQHRGRSRQKSTKNIPAKRTW